jgi:para-aminobenzoate synthetase
MGPTHRLARWKFSDVVGWQWWFLGVLLIAGAADRRRGRGPAGASGDVGMAVTDVEDIVAVVAGMAREAGAKGAGTSIVAIDGRSGSGKTSLAATLRVEFDAPVVALEDLYGGWDGLERGVDLLVSTVLEPLSAGRAARVPRYDWTARRWNPPRTLEPPAVLIVEGVGAGARRAAAYASLLIWVEEPAIVRKKRALDRDGGTFTPYWDMWAAQEDAMLAREHTPARADLVLNLGSR